MADAVWTQTETMLVRVLVRRRITAARGTCGITHRRRDQPTDWIDIV